MEAILELREVSKTYPSSDFELDRISFSLPYGSILGFVGENGAGKTTTIGCILGTLRPDSGEILLFGRTMGDEDTAMREDIGVVYDGEHFPKHLSAGQLEQIMQGIYTRWDHDFFESCLKRFSLPRERKIRQYSRGMSMKLAIAAALSHRPRLLILDEPTGGLDPIMREEILDVFWDFVQEEDHSILFSSHITTDLEKIADYISFIDNGRLILTVSKNELIDSYAVLRLKQSQLERLDPEDILAFRKRDFQIDVLVRDRRSVSKKYPDLVIDPASIDEILLLLVKGDRK